MSEAAAEAPKKKKGKLPIIIAVVLVLGGGGFFMMKKPGGKAEKPKLELASGEAALIELDEKLYNLSDQTTYLRVTIAFHLDKSFPAGHLGKDVTAAIEDAVYTVISEKQPTDFFGGQEKMKKIRRELAAAVNKTLHHEDHEDAADEKGDKKGEKPRKRIRMPKRQRARSIQTGTPTPVLS